MASGSARSIEELPGVARDVIDRARRAFLCTTDRRGFPHAVPVVFVVADDAFVTPIDAKPKTGRPLARIANIRRDERVALLFEEWDEDWTKLAWVMVRGVATLEPGHVWEHPLRERYPQYEQLRLEVGDHAIVVHPDRIHWWYWQT